MDTAALQALVDALRDGRGFAHKRNISDAVTTLARALPGGAADLAQAVAVGDDCAAIPWPGADGRLRWWTPCGAAAWTPAARC